MLPKLPAQYPQMDDTGTYLMSLMSVRSTAHAQRLIQVGSSTSVLNANAALAARRAAQADRADAEAEGIANGAVTSSVSGVGCSESGTQVAEDAANCAVSASVSGDQDAVPDGTPASNDEDESRVEDQVSEGDASANGHRGATRKGEHAAPSGEEVNAKRAPDATPVILDLEDEVSEADANAKCGATLKEEHAAP